MRHDRVWSGGHFKRRPSFRDQVGRFIVTTLGFLTFGYLGRRTR